ncbi:helix-turn-helix transcriptional regulator [Actinoalloteichus caeruleus]|uniref:helix-turn-helix transcriptional regulator n=2 Tax=Actinoalloteichus cyanogriseus TaxID=2893586 RepID=UPI000691FDEA|nr:helix-turn-helix transcriptional regulator [Actinoalloteichus caeruleus]
MAREAEEIQALRRELGEKLSTARKLAGLTQAEVARQVFCDRTTIAHLEKGRVGADERVWRAADRAVRADGLLLEAFLQFRAAALRHASEQRATERAGFQRQAGRWRAEPAGPPATTATVDPSAPTEEPGSLDSACDWLDERAGWCPGTSRDTAVGAGQDRSHAVPARSVPTPDRSVIAGALARYYPTSAEDTAGLYGVRVDGARLGTSVVSRPEWLDLSCPLSPDRDRVRLATARRGGARPLDEHAAVRRLAEATATGVRMTDLPIYQLTNADVSTSRLAGQVELLPFTEYALTMDLLEGELTRALASGADLAPTDLPLRSALLPDMASVLDVAGRLCAGGPLALCAIARPADAYRDTGDYVLLVQRRSAQVVNAAGRLSVIPKGFHAPLTDYRADARIGATLLRELEEELFGRADVDVTVSPQRAADPMHPSRLSEPMRWLIERPGRLRVECTGFGLNLVSGNYEFASLIVIEDEGAAAPGRDRRRPRRRSRARLVPVLTRCQVAEGHRTVITTESASASQEWSTPAPHMT